MFLDEDARGQRVCRVSVDHRHRTLDDDGARVEILRHEMHGHSADLRTERHRLALGVDTTEGGEQRWVDVQDAMRKRLDERRTEAAHEPGKTHEADLTRFQLADE